MFSLTSSSHHAFQRAAQLFISIIFILLLGKLIMLVPVMHQLRVANTFYAAEIIWFLAKLSSLIVFYYFARSSQQAIPNTGGFLSFVKAVAGSLSGLLMAVMVQALLWQILAPFTHGVWKTVYFSVAIILIVSLSIWFILSAYRHSHYIIDTIQKIIGITTRILAKQQLICRDCHSEISKDAKYCSNCGQKIHKALSCPTCGVDIADNQSFCQNCGSNLSEVGSSHDITAD